MNGTQRTMGRVLFDYSQAAAVAIIFALFIRTWIFQPFHIPSPSMEDSLLVGDHIIVNKFALAPGASALERAVLPFAAVRRGDIVVFRPPHDVFQDYVKRVIGLPGETIKIVDKVVHVRAPGEEGYRPLLEPYSVHKDPGGVPPELDNFGPVTVPDDQYFVMGDNRDNSLDSREWGFVPRTSVVGRSLLVYWSFGGGPAADGATAGPAGAPAPGQARRLLTAATAFFTSTRWERTFKIVR